MTSPRRPLRYFARIGNREHAVDIEDDGGVPRVTLDGVPVDADLTLLAEPSLFSLLLDGHSREMVLAGRRGTVHVSLDGESIEVEVFDEVSRALSEFGGGAGTGSLDVAAPMPGVVVSIPVAVGDRILAGQAVVVLEAMKMQNELSAESDGIVERVDVKVGDSVAGGAVLVVLKPAETA